MKTTINSFSMIPEGRIHSVASRFAKDKANYEQAEYHYQLALNNDSENDDLAECMRNAAEIDYYKGLRDKFEEAYDISRKELEDCF